MSYADTLLANGERITLRSRQHWAAILVDARWGFGALVAALVLLGIAIGPLGPGDHGGLVDQFKGLLGIVELVLFVAGLVIISLTVANWLNEEYLVTNRRVMKVSGLINKHSADSSLEKINDAVLDQNVFGRMLNFGDLDIVTAAEETVDTYRMLRAVITFKKEILNQKHDLEFEQMRPPVSPPLRAAPPPPPAMTPSMAGGGMTMGGDTIPGGQSSSNGDGHAGGGHAGGGAGHPAARTMTPAEVTQTLAGLADLRDRGAITPEEYEAKKGELLSRL